MTKYILNSGGLRNQPEKAGKFNRAIVKGLGKTPKVLFCHFAVAREDWEKKFADYTKRFLESMDEETKPKFELAFPDKFIDQIKNNDAVIIHGGDDTLLLYWLKQYNLPKIWEDKVIAVSSAGSNVLAKHFWTCDWRQCFDGLNILPIKFISHYKSDFGANDPRGPIDWDKAYQELSEYGDKTLPIHALEEGDFIIIEK
ncbi:MAG: Type 1 glutamine amidotransferase-like domain-containing protein [Patescibacteria group bacterium]